MSDDFSDLESDTRKGKYLNNINVLGFTASHNLFLSTQKQFIELILELKIDSVFIRELICLLNKNASIPSEIKNR